MALLEVVALAKHYQTKLHESEERLTSLESENSKLKKAMAQSDVTALSEAGYGDIDARLSDLQAAARVLRGRRIVRQRGVLLLVPGRIQNSHCYSGHFQGSFSSSTGSAQ